jgi:2,3-bisphosphoglycerate-independent phosphoglycerate mutase
MKYVILIMDGAADYPLEELGGKTPLQAARKDSIDTLAKKSVCGLLKTIPQNFPPGSTVANLSILGYDPVRYFQGRGVLEAAAMNISLNDKDVALRCNTICVYENGRIKNHSAGHISSEESKLLIQEANERLGNSRIIFYPGVSYRHLLVLKNDYSPDVECFPPHDNVGQPYQNLLVKAKNRQAEKTASLLNEIILNSRWILENHPVNNLRAQQGKDRANMLWPWAAGRRPGMKTFQERFGIKGAVISAVDLIKGLGIYSGFDVINVTGATGLYNTNYEGKAEGCIKALNNHDLVYVHVEAPDEASHEGNISLKVQCIEDFDKRLVGNILQYVDLDNTTISILPDHYTSVTSRAHSSEPIPFLIYSPDAKPDEIERFDEGACKKGRYGLIEGETFIKEFVNLK